MKCSIAMATYNGEKYIKEQMMSLISQSVLADEVIISDDFSTDNTVKIVEEFIKEHQLASWQVVKNAENVGYAKNFYNALKYTKGDIVFLCDQDDVWLPTKIQKMLETMEQNPKIRGLNTLYDIIDSEGKPSEAVLGFVNKNFDGKLVKIEQEQFFSDSKLRGFAGCFRRKLLIDVGIFDPNFNVGIAHDIFLNGMAAVSGENYLLRECLTHYRFSGENASMQYLKNNKKTKKEKAELIDCHLQALYFYKSYAEKHGIVWEVADKKFSIDRFITFEEQRLKLYETKNIFLWLGLIKFYPQYWIIKQGYSENMNLFLQAMRIYGGDLIYALLR
ncbi:MAG: glycosyltransferase [Oscillospiraceae bacterium]